MEIMVYATLRDIVGGASIQVDDVPEITVGELLEKVFARHPALRAEVLNGAGGLNRSIHVFLNGRDVRYLDGLQTLVTPQDSVRLFPPVGGGG